MFILIHCCACCASILLFLGTFPFLGRTAPKLIILGCQGKLISRLEGEIWTNMKPFQRTSGEEFRQISNFCNKYLDFSTSFYFLLINRQIQIIYSYFGAHQTITALYPFQHRKDCTKKKCGLKNNYIGTPPRAMIWCLAGFLLDQLPNK